MKKKGGKGKGKKKRKKGLKLHSIELIGSKIFEGGSRPPLQPPCVNCMQLAHLLLEEKKTLVSLKTKKSIFTVLKLFLKPMKDFDMSFSKEPKINIFKQF